MSQTSIDTVRKTSFQIDLRMSSNYMPNILILHFYYATIFLNLGCSAECQAELQNPLPAILASMCGHSSNLQLHGRLL